MGGLDLNYAQFAVGKTMGRMTTTQKKFVAGRTEYWAWHERASISASAAHATLNSFQKSDSRYPKKSDAFASLGSCGRSILKRGLGCGGEETRQVALLEGAYAIAEGGGSLELKFLGGLSHLRLELGKNFA